MDPLSKELTARGLVEGDTVALAQSYRESEGVSFDSALLELDIVDEEELLSALSASTGLTAATARDLSSADSDVAAKLPASMSESFGICPLRDDGSRVVALVNAPLLDESVQELRELFGIVTRQLIAPEHYVALARSRVYGTACNDRTKRLEARLDRRRALDLREAMSGVDLAASFSDAAEHVLRFAAGRLDLAAFFVRRGEGLRATLLSRRTKRTAALPLPASDCTLAPALVHGGYFFGALRDTDDDRALYGRLERPMPRRAFAAPVLADGTTTIVFYGDNNQLGFPQRWVAELTLLVARLAQASRPRHERGSTGHEASRTAPTSASSDPTRPPPDPSTRATHAGTPIDEGTASATTGRSLSEEDWRAIERVRSAAQGAGMPLATFVDGLLEDRKDSGEAGALAGELKGLFEKLATDIPTHLARGMEAAFRDLAPRVAAPPPGQSLAAASRPRAAASVELVQKEAKPREVADYRSKRRKAARVKL